MAEQGPQDRPLPEDLQERSLILLEFPLVRERLADHTSFALGRELALSLRPSFDHGEVVRLQRETLEASLLLEQGDISFDRVGDVRPLLLRTERGGVLTGEELVQVAGAMRDAWRARSAVLKRRRDAPLLASLAGAIPDLRGVEGAISRALTPAGEVKDTATPALARLRQEVRETYQRLQEVLGRIIRSPLGRAVLQEPLALERQGRPVLAVKAEHRGRLPGLVHDVSESGATVFVEPLAVLPLANRWREARTREAQEVERVLRGLSQEVGRVAPDVRRALEVMARLDLALARARYARATRSLPPRTAPPGETCLRLVEARHPLLSGTVVPVSLEVGCRWRVLLITGPNSGGKTVTLKTAGLLALMHQAGLFLPASEGTTLPVFYGVYADIGDQQDILRSLSTFASHMRAVGEVLERATPRSLVLLDELGSSTDPEEGSALAKALLRAFARRGVPVIATTHQREVAGFVQGQEGMMNASLEMDPETLSPTFRLNTGLPGRSYALAIATRLGLPREVVEEARSLLSPAHRQVEDLLAQVQEERALAEARHREAEEALARARQAQEEAEAHLARLRGQEARWLEEARQRLQERVRALEERLREVERRLREPGAPALAEARVQLARVSGELRRPAWGGPSWAYGLRPGDRVMVKGFVQPAEVLLPPDRRGNLEVRIGGLRARIGLDRLERPAPPPAPPPRRPSPTPIQAGVTAEVDLRGLRAGPALERLDRFLDRAVLEGYARVRVVHGVGTGALATAVRQHLTRHPLVRAVTGEEGNPGVTLVELG